jgi:hypothetical protein
MNIQIIKTPNRKVKIPDQIIKTPIKKVKNTVEVIKN